MNYIDNNFYQLVNTLNDLKFEQIYENIKDSYLKLYDDLKDNIETYLNNFKYWGKLDFRNNNYEEIKEKAKSLKKHLNDYIWLYEKLEDYRSKKLLFAILNNWYKYDFNTLKQCIDTNYSHYFDLDLIKCNNEILVDLGAYTGDTTLDFINTYQDGYKRIYCYEITDEIFETLKNNTLKYPNVICKKKAVTNSKKFMYINNNKLDNSANTINENGNKQIECVSLDEDIKEEITIIKMDIEGSEQDAIKGCINHIKKSHPKLLISVYHNNEDIWKIPRMIDEISPGYKFFLRYHGGNIFPTEITLIAIYDK